MLTSALASNNILTTSQWPLLLATINAVDPSCTESSEDEQVSTSTRSLLTDTPPTIEIKLGTEATPTIYDVIINGLGLGFSIEGVGVASHQSMDPHTRRCSSHLICLVGVSPTIQ